MSIDIDYVVSAGLSIPRVDDKLKRIGDSLSSFPELRRYVS